MNIKFVLAASAALGLAACGDGAQDADMAAENAAADQTSVAENVADPDMPTDAQGLVTAQAASDLYEIEAGRMAQENAANEAVREFGAMMVEDHTTSTENLKTALQQVEGVTVNPQMTAEQRAHLDALREAGDNFDSVYIEQQVAAHEKALGMLRNYAEGGDNPSLQQFAGNTADVVEGHLEQARELHGEIGSQ